MIPRVLPWFGEQKEQAAAPEQLGIWAAPCTTRMQFCSCDPQQEN
jgi:hypothetical protein